MIKAQKILKEKYNLISIRCVLHTLNLINNHSVDPNEETIKIIHESFIINESFIDSDEIKTYQN
jgi:hypothetical protein